MHHRSSEPAIRCCKELFCSCISPVTLPPACSSVDGIVKHLLCSHVNYRKCRQICGASSRLCFVAFPWHFLTLCVNFAMEMLSMCSIDNDGTGLILKCPVTLQPLYLFQRGVSIQWFDDLKIFKHTDTQKWPERGATFIERINPPTSSILVSLSSWCLEGDDHNSQSLFMETAICGHELWVLSASVSKGGS